jgi:hypothetical protein
MYLLTRGPRKENVAGQKSFEAVHQYGRLRDNENILSWCTEGLRALPDDASGALKGRSRERRHVNMTLGDLEKSISLLIETGRNVNASESNREQSGILRVL